MEESLTQLRALLSGRLDPAAAGARRTDATMAPAACGDVPFLLAGWRDVSLRRAAAMGDGWIGYLLSPEGFARRRAFLLECRSELGLDARAFTTGMLLPVHPDPHRDGAQSRAAAAWSTITDNEASFPERLFVAGPPGELVAQLRCYWDAGCTEMVLALVDQGPDYLDQLDLLAREVVPEVRTFA